MIAEPCDPTSPTRRVENFLTKEQNRIMAFIDNRIMCAIYVIIGIMTAITLALCMPPMMNPDEIAHFSRADQISRGHIIGERFDARTAGGEIAIGIGAVNWALREVPMHPVVKVTKEMISEANAARWTDGETRGGFANSVVYPPIFYIPSAIGIVIGKGFNIRVTHTLYISRILSALASVTVGAIAVFISGSAAPWIFAVLTLPTALSFSATLGQEGLLNATAALACACLVQLTADQNERLRTFYSGSIALCLMIMARPPLLPLALILLAIPRVTWDHRAVGLAIVIVGAVGWIAASAPAYVHPRIGMDSTINPDDFGTIKQLDYITAHPLAYCLTLARTLRTFAPGFYQALIGVLGWYDVIVPKWYTLAATISISFAFTASISRRSGLSRPAAVITFVALLGCLVAVMTTLYLAWTPVGFYMILGVQGRYFVAPALFAVLLCPSLTLPPALRSALAATTVGFAAVVTVPLTCLLIVDRYYLA
jgi:uncharacterized membrane protein